MRVHRSLVVLALCAAVPACGSFPATKIEHTPGKVLVLPPRNVVQNGAPHEAGASSGKVLRDAVVERFRDTSYEPLTTDSSSFNHVDVATKDAAIAETMRLGADYCLQLVLGEFRDAAPMTFRSDFATLDSGVLWSVKGEEVWKMTGPFTDSKTNLGSYIGIVQNFGVQVVKSITR